MSNAAKLNTISRRAVLKAGGAVAATVAGASAVAWPNIVLALNKVRIVIVPKGLNNPVFKIADLSGQQRANELGNVEFRFTGSPQSDGAQQVAAIDGLISSGYDGIGISVDDGQTVIEPINRAIAKGIQVITWDSDAPKSKRACFYGVDNVKGGQKQADIMNKLLAGKTGNVWIMSGLPSAPNLQDRLRGVKMNLNKNLTIAGTSFCDEDIAKGVTETENVLRSHPDLIGFIIVGAWPLLASPGALPRLTARAKAGLKVVGFDYVAQELPFIQNGTVTATVGQDYWGWGYQSVQILYNLIKGKKYPDFVPQRIPVVDQSNVADYVEKWKNANTVEGAFKAFGEPPVQPIG